MFPQRASPCVEGLSYSKQITDKTGVVLGYNQFLMKPIIKKYDLINITSLTDDYLVTIKWTGFDEDVLFDAYLEKNITFKVEYRTTMLEGYKTACEITTKNESGYFECNLKNFLERGEYDVSVTPALNQIYEIVEPNIVSCNWVTN